MFGRRKLPADLRPELEPDERVLAWARVRSGGAVVATNRGLWLPLDGVTARLRWHQVHKAVWRPEGSGGELTVIGASSEPLTPGSDIQVSIDSAPATFALESPRALPRRVQGRVNASIAYNVLERMPGGSAVRIMARRVSGRDGLDWFVRYEGPVAYGSPAVISATEGLVTAAREGIGRPE